MGATSVACMPINITAVLALNWRTISAPLVDAEIVRLPDVQTQACHTLLTIFAVDPSRNLPQNLPTFAVARPLDNRWMRLTSGSEIGILRSREKGAGQIAKSAYDAVAQEVVLSMKDGALHRKDAGKGVDDGDPAYD
jgi:hypothetical protein